MSQKRFLSLVLVLVMSLVMVTASASAQEQIVLEFPTWQATEAGISDFWKAIIEIYEAEHPNVKINMEQVAFKDFVNTMTIRTAGNTAPAIYHLPCRNFVQFASQGWLQDLSADIATTDINASFSSLQNKLTYEGKEMGVMLFGYGYVMYYNKKILEDAGVSVPTSLEELIHVAEVCTQGDIYGFGATTIEHPNCQQDLAQLIIGTGNAYEKDGEYLFTSPGTLEAVEAFRTLLNYAPKGVTTEQKREIFFAGNIACMFDIPSLGTNIDKAPEGVREYLDVARIPLPYTPGATSNGLHIATGIEEPIRSLVWDFIELASSERGARLFFENYQAIPVRQNIVTEEDIQVKPRLAVVREALENAVLIEPENPVLQLNYTEFQSIVASYIMKMLSSSESTADIMAELHNELEFTIPLK